MARAWHMVFLLLDLDQLHILDRARLLHALVCLRGCHKCPQATNLQFCMSSFCTRANGCMFCLMSQLSCKLVKGSSLTARLPGRIVNNAAKA
eukprot:1158754-Pelagomonas_calceolata.AAC.6